MTENHSSAMNQYQTERRLSWCYGLLAGLLSICVICVGVTYNHWKATLDQCPGSWLENNNCGCIFYGVTTSQYFNGGHNSYCLFAVFAPIPLIVYAIVMVLFHMYRVCINNVGQFEDEKTADMEEIEGESIVVTSRARVTHGNDAVIHCWVPTACLAAVFAIYNLVYASIITDGYFKTCTQYRSFLVRQFGAIGDQASALRFRLACQAIFDYMDYTQKDSRNSRAGNYINTGAALQVALIAAWAGVALWLAAAAYTAVRAYKERRALTCCGN